MVRLKHVHQKAWLTSTFGPPNFENNIESSCSPDRFPASRRSTKLLPSQTHPFWWCAMGQHHHPSASTLACWFIFPFLQATSPRFPFFNYLVYRVPVFVPTLVGKIPIITYHLICITAVPIYSSNVQSFPSLDRTPRILCVKIPIFAGEITIFARSF